MAVGKPDPDAPIGVDAVSTSIVKPDASGLNLEYDGDVEGQGKTYAPLDQRKNVTLAKGHWYNATWHIATTICTPAAYAPLALAYGWLGWPAGVICLFLATLVSCYNSYLLTQLHEVPETGRRRVRYAQVAEEIYGGLGYWSVTFFQQVASIGNNIACEIGAALAMQAIYNIYQPNGTMTTQHFIVIFASFQFVLSQLPDIHHLSYFNLLSTVCTIGFTITCLALNIWTGYRWRSLCNEDTEANAGFCPSFEYGGGTSSTADIIFGVFSSLGTIAFGFGDTILPEIQATIRNPHMRNTQWGLFSAYAIIAFNYFAIAVSGYWGFGFATTTAPWLPVIYAPPAISEEQNWALVLVNLFGIIQIAGCFQIYCRPTYEWVDIKVQDSTKGPWYLRNVIARFCVTFVYSALMTLVSCALPFFGDFVALVGAVGFIPLDFVVPMILYNRAMKPTRSTAIIHWVIAFVFTMVGVVGFIGACRWINVHIHTYQFFGNVGAPLPPPAGDYYAAADPALPTL